MGLISQLIAALRPRPPRELGRGTPYRSEEHDPEVALQDLRRLVAAMQLRIRVLERQLEARGEIPVATPTGRQLKLVVDILDGLARLESPNMNTLKIGQLADYMRGLSLWVD
jgi:hypothetical protein